MGAWLDSVVEYLPAVFAVLILLVWLAAIAAGRRFAKRRALEWLGHQRHFAGPDPAIPATLEGDDPLVARLAAQLVEARNGAHHHLKVAVAFAAYQFPTLTIATVAAVLAGVLLVPISAYGWTQSAPELTVPFLTSAAISIVMISLARVFRQPENIRDNLDRYAHFVALEDEILSFAARRQALAVDTEKVEEFVVKVDRRLREIRRLAIGFDPAQVPTASAVFSQLSTPLAEPRKPDEAAGDGD